MNDIEFLRRISSMLHAKNVQFPNLSEFERFGELIFIPMNGGKIDAWSERLAPLHRSEFHIYSRDLAPANKISVETVAEVNCREHCRAVISMKRCLESYLHPEAIQLAGQISLSFDDFDCVAELAARAFYKRRPEPIPWEHLSRRAQRRMANRAKHWLCTAATDHMTTEMLLERDPTGEIGSWMLSIAQMLNS
jgi:hypothetical protein